MRILMSAALLAGAMLLGGCVPQQGQPVYGTPVRGPGCDTSIRFVNNSSVTVLQLFYNPSNISNWGPDRLGQNVLRPGQTSAVRLSNPGAYDFRVVWNNGRSAEIRQVNVCAASQIHITNAGLRAI